MSDLKCSSIVSDFLRSASTEEVRSLYDLALYEMHTVNTQNEIPPADSSPYSFVYVKDSGKYFIMIPSGYNHSLNCVEIASSQNPKVIVRTASSSTLSTILLEQGELAFTLDTKKVYVGDGSTYGGNLVGISPSVINSKILDRIVGNGSAQYFRILSVSPGTTVSLSITSSTGYKAAYWWDYIAQTSSGTTASHGGSSAYMPKENIFWPCVSLTDGSLSGNITAISIADTYQVYHADVTRLTALTSLSISAYTGTSIDLSKNTALTSLTLKGTASYIMPSLDLSTNQYLSSITTDYVSALNISNNNALTSQYAVNSYVSMLNVSNTPNLQGLSFSAASQIKNIVADYNSFTSSGITISFSGITGLKPDELYRMAAALPMLKDRGLTFTFYSIQDSSQLFIPETSSGVLSGITQPFKDGEIYTGIEILEMIVSKAVLVIQNASYATSYS